MDKTLFCGIDLHSNNAVHVITDAQDRQLFCERLPNDLAAVLGALEPYRDRLKAVAVESTYNGCWLVDGLHDYNYPVCLANPAKTEQYDGIKEANDLTDAAFVTHLLWLGVSSGETARWVCSSVLGDGHRLNRVRY